MSKRNTFEPTEPIETTEVESQNEENILGAVVQAESAELPSAVPIAPNRAEPVIYCGPNIPKGNLLSMAVFRGGIPGNVQRLVEKIPEISRMIVPVSQLADTKKKIAEHGSEENRLNQVILAAREGI
jgi:hypothetical protein